MKYAFFSVMTFFLFAATTQAEPIPLFHGTDMTGWDIYLQGSGDSIEKVWSVNNQVLHCSGKVRGYVITKRAYADYILRLEWRWPEGDFDGHANSGVHVHAVGPDQLWPKSFEAQLLTGHAGNFLSFEDARNDNEIVSRNPEGVSTGRFPRKGPSTEKPIGEWNLYEIIARGDELILKVNGKEVNRMSGVTPSGGHIALQSEDYPIEFRNITLEPLPPAKDLHAPMPK